MRQQRTGRQPSLGTRGMVAAPHHTAARAGVRMLERGGSAADAAIAANAVLGAVYPHMAGPGGDLFCLLWDASTRRLVGLNASGRAAGAATIDLFRSRGHESIPIRGPLAAVTVPGAVDGWALLHAKFGRLPFGDLLGPAIELADEGFAVPESLANWSTTAAEVLEGDPTLRATYRPAGRPLRTGERLANPRLGATLQQIARGGAGAFYLGSIAEVACRYLRERGGVLTPDDFAAHRSDWVEPISAPYRGITAYQLPPNTQGVSALQMLRVAERFDLQNMGDGSPGYIHTLAETARLVLDDRDHYVADSEHVDVPVRWLLSDERTAEIRDGIDPSRRPPLGEKDALTGDTCYLCAVDREGNAVSLIQSVFYDFGSGVIAGDSGLLLQNRGSFFSLDENHPNRLEPGKRTLHTLIPAMLFADGEPSLVYGTMGGDGQPQTQAAVVTRVLDFGYDIQRAVEAPRWLYGRTWGAKSVALSLEASLGDETAARLAGMGHDVRVLPHWSDSFGHAQAIWIDRQQGVYWGAADPRGDGAAMGW